MAGNFGDKLKYALQVTQGRSHEYDGIDSRVPTFKTRGDFSMFKDFAGNRFNDCALLFFIILFLLLFTNNRGFFSRDDAGIVE